MLTILSKRPGMVLRVLDDYIESSTDAQWIEAEFQRESRDYWSAPRGRDPSPKK
jgi:hypothetical protein